MVGRRPVEVLEQGFEDLAAMFVSSLPTPRKPTEHALVGEVAEASDTDRCDVEIREVCERETDGSALRFAVGSVGPERPGHGRCMLALPPRGPQTRETRANVERQFA